MRDGAWNEVLTPVDSLLPFITWSTPRWSGAHTINVSMLNLEANTFFIKSSYLLGFFGGEGYNNTKNIRTLREHSDGEDDDEDMAMLPTAVRSCTSFCTNTNAARLLMILPPVGTQEYDHNFNPLSC